MSTSFAKLAALFDHDASLDDVTLHTETAEHEYFVARGELRAGGNLQHGAKHLAELLTYDPSNASWLRLLDAYLERADIETLLPRDPENLYYATEAVRTQAWARQGQVTEALDLLVRVDEAAPQVGYVLAWAAAWLEAPGVLETVPGDTAVSALGAALNSMQPAHKQTVHELQHSRRVAAVARRLWPRHAELTNTAMVVAGLLRKSGQFEEALQFLRDTTTTPTWHSEIAQGLVLRESGAPDEAVAAFARGLAHDPDDLAARLEAGDTLLDVQRWEEALPWYDAVLQRAPQHPWAHPSSLWCRSKLQAEPGSSDDPNVAPLVALDREGNGRARGLIQSYHRFIGYMPPATDALANMLRNVLAQGKSFEGDTPIGVSYPEAPSNVAALRMAMPDCNPVVEAGQVPSPDPRRPCTPIRYEVWRLNEGTGNLEPALPPPPPELADAVRTLAAHPFDRAVLFARASRLQADHATATVPQWLACVCHPPAPSGPVEDVTVWIRRVQLVVTDVLANLDQGWDGSQRQAALLSVLHGPMDWSTEAAILSCTLLAQREPWLQVAITEAFRTLEAARPDEGAVCWEPCLYTLWPRIPGLTSEQRGALYDKLDVVLEA